MERNSTAIPNAPFDHRAFMAKYGGGTVAQYDERRVIYAQGDPSNALFYIVSGSVKVTIVSEFGKEAVIAILGAGDFFGEGCLDGHLLRNSTITATTVSEIARLERAHVARAINEDQPFAVLLFRFILDRKAKLQADLVDHLFNSSEKRLARTLMTLVERGFGQQMNSIPISINQETLANMVGTTRSRINQFMNKFRKLGYIDYDSNGQIKVDNAALSVILQVQPQPDTRAQSETS